MKVWIVLPAFNEAESLPPLLDNIVAMGCSLAFPYGVLVVNDGSKDATAAVALSYATRLPLQLISHEGNRGLARTIETGLRTVLRDARDDDVVVTMDADNTHSPVLIPRMVREIANGADLVIASRYAPGGAEEGVPFTRRILSHGVSVLMRLRFGMRELRDFSCGYRAYRAAILQEALRQYGDRLIEARGFTVMAELLVKLAPLCHRTVEVPLHLRYDLKRSGSKMRVLQTTYAYSRLLCGRTPRGVQVSNSSGSAASASPLGRPRRPPRHAGNSGR